MTSRDSEPYPPIQGGEIRRFAGRGEVFFATTPDNLFPVDWQEIHLKERIER
jgi:hypothetical protein